MTTWFSNKGQMIQVVCALVAATVALMVWLAIPPQNLLYLAPVIFLACLLWASWVLGARSVRPDANETSATEVIETFGNESSRAIARPSTLPIGEPTTDGSISGMGTVADYVIAVGERCQVGGDHLSPITVAVHQVRKFQNKNVKIALTQRTPEYEADIEVQHGAGIYGGSITKQITHNRYFAPAYPDAFHSEPYSLYSYSFTEKHFSFFSIRISHINTHAGQVAISVCQARGSKL